MLVNVYFSNPKLFHDRISTTANKRVFNLNFAEMGKSTWRGFGLPGFMLVNIFD